ncbi:MAG: KxYKxGKxW signal peptide domain-containing protein [Stygiobacter sp.]
MSYSFKAGKHWVTTLIFLF